MLATLAAEADDGPAQGPLVSLVATVAVRRAATDVVFVANPRGDPSSQPRNVGGSSMAPHGLPPWLEARAAYPDLAEPRYRNALLYHGV